MRTEKQVKASKRNFMIMYLTGMLTMIQLFKNMYVCNPYWKKYLIDISILIVDLLKRIKNEEDYQNHMYGTNTPSVKPKK